ncbi:hypothetical protein GBW32_12205 [Streptomyces tsukubensis]|uniref:Protein kinase domain-containing protein n=1 Tax=Streptomyces tsukubensis TaxID=83656 RepID=A0A1V4A673_9ACTN|nr:hypothetical protein B1H18_21390 [Streptomyces tsukubensis]QFR97691.1 hypothetical protein GBW32_12205 [Streptomyces tsukubensis]
MGGAPWDDGSSTGPFPCCPTRARAAAEEACGGPVGLAEVTHRRGAAVWKATVHAGTSVAVKAGYGEVRTVTAREAEALRLLPGYRVVSGQDDDVGWFVTPWLSGPSTWEVFRPVREGGPDRGGVLEAADGLCRAVAALHALGWVHSDLQPDHGILTDDGVRLIDLSWALRPGSAPDGAFRGGIPHLVAPELSARLALAQHPVTPTAAADVYALAGTLWACVTGRWPLDYRAEGIDPTQLTCAELHAVIAGRRLPLDDCTRWPAMRDTLRPVLLGHADDRPAAAELAGMIRAVDPPPAAEGRAGV